MVSSPLPPFFFLAMDGVVFNWKKKGDSKAWEAFTNRGQPYYSRVLEEGIRSIVKTSSWAQSIKGIVSAGFVKSSIYALAKVSKARNGRRWLMIIHLLVPMCYLLTSPFGEVKSNKWLTIDGSWKRCTVCSNLTLKKTNHQTNQSNNTSLYIHTHIHQEQHVHFTIL